MFNSLKNKKKYMASLLLGLILAPLFAPMSALAAAAFPATPQDPTATDFYCFTTLSNKNFCYPTMGQCNTEIVISAAPKLFSCQDLSKEKSFFEKIMGDVESFPKAAGNATLSVVGGLIMDGVALIAELINKLAAIFLTSMAFILDMSIERTINGDTYRNLAAVKIGWTAVRDISNMFFIFVLLYIAIQTILGLAGSNTKRWVAHLIIAAILINFSLFATQVVIDAGNVLSVGFWSNIKTQQGSNTGSSAAAQFMQAFKIQTVYSNEDAVATSSGSQPIQLDATNRAMINLGGALIMFIAGYVFLAGAIMMIIRTVTLLILMIASPFAFLGFSLPKGGGFASKWLSKLLGATFVAPVFILMLYLDSIIITSLDLAKMTGSSGMAYSAAFTGSPDNFAIIYNFAITIILLLASLTVAHEVSNGVGASAGGWAKKAIGIGGAAGIATGAYGLRRTVGAGAERLKNNEAIQKAAQQTGLKGMMARTAIRTSNVAAKSSFDVRNAPGMNSAGAKALGGLTGVSFGAAGGAGGERARNLSRNQDVIKRAEELFPNNPVAQQNYIRNATKPLPGMESRYDKKPSEFASKDEKTLASKKKELEGEVKKKDAKAKIESSKADQKDIDNRLAANTITPEAAKAEGEVIALAVKDAMQKISVTDRAELAESHKDNAHFVNNLNKSDFATIHRMELEGKYTGVVGSVTEKAMGGDNFELQQYLTNPENKNRLTAVDQDAILSNPKLMENYEKRIAQKEIGKSRIKDINRAHEEAIKENEDKNLLNSIGTV